MSGVAPAVGTWGRLARALAFLGLLGLYGAAHIEAPESISVAGPLTAVGFLLLGGTLLSELVEVFGLPHLSGYLLCGILVGPHGLGLVEAASVETLSRVNGLALALIALAGGAELRATALRACARSQAWAALVQTIVVGVVVSAAFFGAAPWLPLPPGVSRTVVLGVAILWGVVAVSRSPAAVLGIYAQTRPRGPLSEFTLGFVMLSDVVVVVLLAVTMTGVRPLIVPGAELSFDALSETAHEIVGSVALGTTIGLALAAYLRFVGKQLLIVLLILGLGLTEILRVLHFDPLLTYIVAGIVVRNASAQGDRLLSGVEALGGAVFVVFFATAGAHLDLSLLTELWPVALFLASVRALATYGASVASARLANDPPVLRRLGFSGLVSQAGLTLGLSVVVAAEFPSIAQTFATLAIATVAINELVGPIILKWALDRAGESEQARAAAADSSGDALSASTSVPPVP